MKRIGIIGGISWESTAHYYEALNEGVKQRLGGFHSAPILLWSVDFAEIEVLQASGQWDVAGGIFADIATALQAAGAQCILIAANTMHIVASQVQGATDIPLLHIGAATAEAIAASGLKRVLLLGTRYTMEEPFLKDYLSDRGVQVVVPGADDILEINRIIYEELCLGLVKDSSRSVLQDIIGRHESDGIEGVILGCTELCMILRPADVDLALFDTTILHVEAALRFCLEDPA